MTTRYIANIGHEAAERFAGPFTDFAANGITVEDLGDGRIRFGQNALNWMRDNTTEDEDGFIDDEGSLRIWVGGMPCDIERDGE